jgi:uncharacterized membrane protein
MVACIVHRPQPAGKACLRIPWRRRVTYDPRMPPRPIAILLALTIWSHAIRAWPELPDRIPIHYGIDGTPDGFADRSAWTWFGLSTLGSGISLLICCLLPVMALSMARRNSQLINVPDRRYYQLPTAGRIEVVRCMMQPIAWLGIWMGTLFLHLQYGAEQIAHGAWERMPGWPMWVLLALIAVSVIRSITATRSAVNRLQARNAIAAPDEPEV